MVEFCCKRGWWRLSLAWELWLSKPWAGQIHPVLCLSAAGNCCYWYTWGPRNASPSEVEAFQAWVSVEACQILSFSHMHSWLLTMVKVLWANCWYSGTCVVYYCIGFFSMSAFSSSDLRWRKAAKPAFSLLVSLRALSQHHSLLRCVNIFLPVFFCILSWMFPLQNWLLSNMCNQVL